MKRTRIMLILTAWHVTVAIFALYYTSSQVLTHEFSLLTGVYIVASALTLALIVSWLTFLKALYQEEAAG